MNSFSVKNVSVIAVLGTAFALGCATLAFAQEGSAPPPPPPQPPPSSGGFGGVDFGGGHQPPPPPSSGGFGGGDFGGGHQPPPPGGSSGGYQQEYQKQYQQQYQEQYRQESQKQMEQRGQDMRGGDSRMMQQGRVPQGMPPPDMMRGGGPEGGMMRGGQGKFDSPRGGGPEGGMMRYGEERGGFGGDHEGGGDYGEDDSEARQAEMEAREAEMQKRQLSEMKRNLRGLEQGLKMTKSMMDKLTKQGVAVPAEYATLITELTNALAVLKGATEMTDEVQAAMEVLMEKGEELRDVGPKLGMLSEWPRTLKQAEAQVKRLQTQLARVKKSKSSAAYPALIAKVEAHVGEVAGAFAQAKSEAAGGDLEAAMETLRDGVFEATEDAYDSMRVLENMANMSRIVKQAEKEIARYEKEAARYEKKGQDVSTLRGLIAEMKRVLAEVKSTISDTSADPEELFDTMNSAEGLRNDAEAELQHLRGRPSSAEKQIQSSTAEKADASIGKALQALRK